MRSRYVSPNMAATAVALMLMSSVGIAELRGEEVASATVYTGMCDASAAVPLSSTLFLVADDERNTLHVYDVDRPGRPVASFPWDEPLGIDPREDEHPEADIEGATMLDGRIYWIASHGRSKKGKWRPNRHRFFALTARATDGEVSLRPFGERCKTLVRDLVEDDRFDELGLPEAVAFGVKQVEELAPKRKGLNIEGLCAAKDGGSLLIAFRNPQPDHKALLVPLLNPAAVITEAERPRFGEPIALDLEVEQDGETTPLGIRSIEYSPRHGGYLMVAGPTAGGRPFALYRWSGDQTESPKLLQQATSVLNRLEEFSPEALVVYPDRMQLQVLSDDGSRKVKVDSPAECQPGEYDDGYCEAKYLLDDNRKTFRSVWVDAR